MLQQEAAPEQMAIQLPRIHLRRAVALGQTGTGVTQGEMEVVLSLTMSRQEAQEGLQEGVRGQQELQLMPRFSMEVLAAAVVAQMETTQEEQAALVERLLVAGVVVPVEEQVVALEGTELMVL